MFFEAIAVVGATASGKSEIAVQIARKLREVGHEVELISADSRKIFKYFDIGTAKPVHHLGEFRWHFISEIEPWEKFSAKEFEKKARELIRKLKREGKIPIVVGGTWFYIRALEKGLFPEPEDRKLREELEKVLELKGREELIRILREVDPKALTKISPNDTYRVIRAIEIKKKTGRSITEIKFLDQLVGERFPLLKIGIWRRKEELRKRIKERIHKQIKRGLIEETEEFVRLLEKMKESAEHNVEEKHTGKQQVEIAEMQAKIKETQVEIKEIPAVLKAIACYEPYLFITGKITFDEMIELMVRRNFKYAKYQLKVFSREGTNWFDDEKKLVNFAFRFASRILHENKKI